MQESLLEFFHDAFHFMDSYFASSLATVIFSSCENLTDYCKTINAAAIFALTSYVDKAVIMQ